MWMARYIGTVRLAPGTERTGPSAANGNLCASPESEVHPGALVHEPSSAKKRKSVSEGEEKNKDVPSRGKILQNAGKWFGTEC